jgi:hypothetical protein
VGYSTGISPISRRYVQGDVIGENGRKQRRKSEELLSGAVPGKIGNGVFRGLAAVGTADVRHRIQPPEVVEGLVAFLILAMKFPERVFHFGHA